MPAEFTSFRGENGLLGSGSIGGTFGGCWAHVSHEPSSSDTRSKLSLNRAVSLSFSPATGLGIIVAGFGRGPGSLALNIRSFSATTTVVRTAPRKTAKAVVALKEEYLLLRIDRCSTRSHRENSDDIETASSGLPLSADGVIQAGNGRRVNWARGPNRLLR